MLNAIWVSIILISSAYAFFSGRAADLGNAFFDGAEGCVTFILKIGAFMIMWQGMLNIAEKSGLSKRIAALMSPVICFIFKGVKRGSRELGLIANNITANMLGLSNAATPLGISAMKELAKKSKNSAATDDMCLFAVINSASLQLVPSTLIAMRASFYSTSPGEITVPIWIVSSMTVIFAVVFTKIMEK